MISIPSPWKEFSIDIQQYLPWFLWDSPFNGESDISNNLLFLRRLLYVGFYHLEKVLFYGYIKSLGENSVTENLLKTKSHESLQFVFLTRRLFMVPFEVSSHRTKSLFSNFIGDGWVQNWLPGSASNGESQLPSPQRCKHQGLAWHELGKKDSTVFIALGSRFEDAFKISSHCYHLKSGNHSKVSLIVKNISKKSKRNSK